MFFKLKRLKTLILAFCAATALFGQVDSKLLTKTDLLDVYKNGGATPELLTVFDFSGSMVNCFWHAQYWTDQNSDFGNQMSIDPATGVVSLDIGNGVTATGFLVEPSGAKITTLPITEALAMKASHARLTASVTGVISSSTTTQTYSISNAAYSNSPKRITYTTTTSNTIQVGDIVTVTGLLPTAYNVTSATVTAVTSTSFTVRVTANPGTLKTKTGQVTVQHITTISGTYTRTLDIPTPWTILQVPTSLPSTGTAPVPDYFVDPSSGSNVVFDTYYSLAANRVLTPDGGGGYTLGYFTYNPDYSFWLFWGNVVKADDGNSFDPNPPGGVKDDRNQAPTSGTFSTSAGTFAGAPNNGTYPGGGGFIVPGVYDPAYGSTSTPSATVWSNNRGTTFNNGIPVGTRSQFLKKAVLTTWLSKQGSVLWAYRFLDNANEPNASLKSDNFNSGQRVLTRFTSVKTGIHASVQTIQQKFPSGSTPLTGALANAYAQMVESATNSSIFDYSHTGLVDSPCSSSFVVIFTDGLANNESIGSGEIATNATTAVNNESDIQNLAPANLNAGKSNYNIWSLAAVAAHGVANGTNNASQQTTGTGLPSAYAPFRVMTRGASAPGRKITTMTVGLSLAGSNTTGVNVGGKGPLLRTALYGDPKVSTYDLAHSVSGTSLVAPTGSGIKTNFFDASDPNALVGALKDIINRITQANTSIVAPAAPLVGLNLGNRVYLGRFASTNAGVGSIWQGDLLMAGLGIQSDGTVGLKDKGGSFQTDINADNAVASASAALKALGWKNRKVYTALPGTTTLVPFTDSNTTTLTPKVMGVTSDPEAQNLIRFIQGAADPTDPTNPANRLDIMGDIINSSPAAVEYDPALLSSAGSTVLSDFWAANSSDPSARFQVIYVGDNQGHFHAFGEVSYLDASGVLQAAMDELWSFVPSELLNSPSVTTVIPKLSKLQASGNDHIYTVDGSPYVYFKDSSVSGSPLGNRRVNSTDTIRVIVGMRKGGRSYYAFDVANPGSPVLSWVLDPNTSSDPTIKTMGLATSTPAVARVETGSSPAAVKDVLILGGGYSNNDLDALTIGNNSGPTKLGRSLLAIDVTSGSPVKLYDFVNNGTLAADFPNMGAIGAGGFPFEFYVGSKKAQRVYFGDLSGGVYALGSMQTLTTAPVGWRVDSSNIDQWTTDGSLNVSSTPANAGVRWIYKGLTTVSGGKVIAASPISSTPVAYRVPTAIPEFRRPATSSNAANMIPPVVGVTFGTGDRNDPMDAGSVKPVASNPLRQIMVFDRQDSADLPGGGTFPSNVNTSAGAITDDQLSDQTATATVGNTSYLGNNQYLGYKLLFHKLTDIADATHLFYEKSYLNSTVLNGALLFSTFKPGRTGVATICEGAGNTLTFRMCDALAPLFNKGEMAVADALADKLATGCNGYIFSWTNLAGDLTSIGSRMVIQSGQDTPVTGGGAASNNVKIQDLIVKSGTQSFAPRAWRIVR